MKNRELKWCKLKGPVLYTIIADTLLPEIASDSSLKSMIVSFFQIKLIAFVLEPGILTCS